MKKTIILFLLLSCLGLTQAEAKIVQESANKDKTYVKIWVDGLACPFCAYGLEKKMKKLKGLENLTIDLNNGFITFEVPSEKILSENLLKKIIKEAGFVARKFEYATKPFKVIKKTKD